MKTIIFTQFARMAHIIFNELSTTLLQTKIFLATGKTKNKLDIVNGFNMYAGNAILVSTDTLNYGFNIQSADSIIHFDLPYTPAKISQREGRGDRMSRSTKLLVIDLVTINSFEDKIVKILAIKQEYIKEAILGRYVGMNDREVIEELFKINNNIYKQTKLV